MKKKPIRLLGQQLIAQGVTSVLEIQTAIFDEFGHTPQEATVKRWLDDVPSAFAAECAAQGIPIESVRNYWYKSQHFSIHVAPGKPEVLTAEEIVDNLVEKIKNHTPDYSNRYHPKELPDPHLLVIDIADAHFGKLVSAYQGGEEYSIQIAKKRVIEGFFGLLKKAESHNVERILLMIGNDVLHVDNARSTTTKGTYQDSDVMFFDMFNVALETYVLLLESIVDKYEIDVIFNPSNHDYASGFMFARTLEAWFRSAKNVTFSTDMAHRKYYQYGTSMIGSTHGDGAKFDKLPLLMANEAKHMWAATTFRYVYVHHFHHKIVEKYLSTKDYVGVTVEALRSPSEADSWHHIAGYTGVPKAIECFLHSKTMGQDGRFTHYF